MNELMNERMKNKCEHRAMMMSSGWWGSKERSLHQIGLSPTQGLNSYG